MEAAFIFFLTQNLLLSHYGALTQVNDPKNPIRLEGLDAVPAEDGYIIYEQANDRIHYLNPVASLIFELCSGNNSPEEIAQLVREAFGLTDPPVNEVEEALNKMKSEGLLV